MNYADIKKVDSANGPGVRVSLFVSGCRLNCKGCFNKEAQDFNYGKPFTHETIQTIIEYLRPEYIDGLTVLGGEPFERENQLAVVELLRKVRAEYGNSKTIWVYSGYLFDKDMLNGKLKDWRYTREILSYTDVLVDGPFILELKDLRLKFRGSSNQRIILVGQSLKKNDIILWEN